MNTILIKCSLLAGFVGLCGCATQRHEKVTPAPAAVPQVITVYMVGDSTMANKPLIPANPERGWGQMLQAYFKDTVRVSNHALNGRSSKSFIDEGKWQPVVDAIKPGDYVIIQFGHNDQPGKGPKRETQPFGTYKQNLERYVRETREKQGNPVLATSVVRRKFNADGRLDDTHGDYILATRQVASEQNVTLLDLNKLSAELVLKMGEEQSKRLFDWIPAGEFARYPKELKDDTHFNAFGASRICDLAVEEMNRHVPALAQHLNQPQPQKQAAATPQSPNALPLEK